MNRFIMRDLENIFVFTKSLSSLFILLVLFTPCPGRAEVIDRVLVTVNGEIITQGDLERAVEVYSLGNPGTEKNKGELKNEVLEELVNRRLLIQESRSQMISEVPDTEVEQAVKEVRRAYSTEEQFREALAGENLTEGELKEQLRDQLLIQRFIERRIRLMVRVDVDEVRRFFEANQAGQADHRGDKAFKEVRDDLRQLMIEKKTNEKLDEHLKMLKEKADIQWN